MTASRIRRLFLLSLVGLGCRAAESVPEPGAALVRVTVTAGAPGPDELRAWVYDDGGRLWDGVRIPAEGALTIKSATDLGTVLIQPGLVQGNLRLHVRGYAAGTRILDGVLSMTGADREKKTVALVLDPSVFVDADDDDVPDVIDDCLDAANPLQGGCPTPTGDAEVDAGIDAQADADPDARSDAQTDAVADATADVSVDATTDITIDATADITPDSRPDGGVDATDGGKALGVTCTAGAQCTTGFCVDGVCCANACTGLCRSCNQAGVAGTCKTFVAGGDPEKECGLGMTCNGAGACAAIPTKANGRPCLAASECNSGFCSDKVCCDTACSGQCQNCATGACLAVKRMDDVPECSGANTCSAKGDCVPG